MDVPHIDYARGCDLVLVAPATADFIAKLAHGLADDLLSTACLYSTAPLFVAPAMNVHMWRHPSVRDNAAVLRRRGVRFLGPGKGFLACGEEGEGRMLESLELERHMAAFAGKRWPGAGRPWAGLKVLVTAGPTREPLDPVRYLSNRSSGLMGYSLAEKALDLGAETVLVSGPTALTPPPGATVVDVETAREMRRAVLRHLPGARLTILAAAVADWRPRKSVDRKIKKREGVPEMRLIPNPDILEDVLKRRKRWQVVVGFAAETDHLARNAREKLRRKPCDVLAANRVGKGVGMESPFNRLKLYGRKWNGAVDLGTGRKGDLAMKMLGFLDGKFRIGART